MPGWLTIVGIGENGFASLARPAREALLKARLIVGGERHIALLPTRLRQRSQVWPRPFSIDSVLQQRGIASVCVLASGDPMLYGVGASFARALPVGEYTILPSPSSFSLAAARLGWPLQEVDTISLVGRPLAALNKVLHHGVRLLALSNDGASPAAVAALLDARGFGASRMWVLEHLDGPHEQVVEACASDWLAAGPSAALNLIAIECRADHPGSGQSLTPGLPDDAYRHDGQLTKRDVRAIVLARLAPQPGECLWDVGAGCGSISIEWMRSSPRCSAIAIEANLSRQGLIAHNRDALGVPSLRLVEGEAPAALVDLPRPDAIFIGGGVTAPGLIELCAERLVPGGRLLANVVTLQGEAILIAWRAKHGGSLTRIEVAQAAALGRFDTWRQALPVTLLEWHKEPTASASTDRFENADASNEVGNTSTASATQASIGPEACG